MFAHLHVHTSFSMLDGANSIEDFVDRAAELGMDTMAVTDHNNVSVSILFNKLASSRNIKAIQGAEITLNDGNHLTLLAKNNHGYSNLCKILTAAHLESQRLNPKVAVETVADYRDDLYIMSGCRRGELPSLILAGDTAKAETAARRYKDLFGDSFVIELQNSMLPSDSQLNRWLAALGGDLDIPIAATGNVHYATRDSFNIHDVLTCIRTRSTLEELNPYRPMNAEQYLFDDTEAQLRFKRYPEALKNARIIADTCEPSVILGRPMFPKFIDIPEGESPFSYLNMLVYEGASGRYGDITDNIRTRLDYELDVIRQLGLEEYFLFVWDVVRYARSQNIRYEGRGSAADSAVVYCLRISNVDSIKRGLMFERFLSLERAQLPDIDIDFDARKRDIVSDYVYNKYGREHVATVCTFSRFHTRSAIRDIGKVLGFGPKEIDILAKRFPHIRADGIEAALAKYPELRESSIPMPKYEYLFSLCKAISGFPRHVGTHLGGIVVCREPITNVSPIQHAAKGVTITQFDKDYIEDLGVIKLDLLCLRTLSAVEDTDAFIKGRDSGFSYDEIPDNDSETFEMLRTGETIGVFQLESPGQRSLQSRLGANRMEDLVASVALIRPGPIEGNMVEPFIKRRNGGEEIKYIHPKLKPILEKTYGVVLYQEQVIQIATAIAGFTAGEADGLRRAMSKCRSREDMYDIGRNFVERAVGQGVDREAAETICSYIVGYAGYGFCEAHAAAFAATAYKTAYLIKHYPAEFYASILNNQPMGYYSPRTICTEARRRGIKIYGPDINLSGEQYNAKYGRIRVSLSQIRGVGPKLAKEIAVERESNGIYRTIQDLCHRVRAIEQDALENMVLCGCFDSLCSNRRRTLWMASKAIEKRSASLGGLYIDNDTSQVQSETISDFNPFDKFLYEYKILGFSPGEHLISYFRPRLQSMGLIKTSELRSSKPGQWVRMGGLSVRPHRPPTRSGRTIVFLSLEDEDGLAEVIIFEDTYQKYGNIIFTQPALIVEGQVQERGNGVYIIASRISKFPGLSISD